MTSIGQGVREIRVRDTTGAFRIIYVSSIEEAVFVLHVFQKKAQRTPQRDLTLAQNRFKQLKRGARP
jgi:phage-related protein